MKGIRERNRESAPSVWTRARGHRTDHQNKLIRPLKTKSRQGPFEKNRHSERHPHPPPPPQSKLRQRNSQCRYPIRLNCCRLVEDSNDWPKCPQTAVLTLQSLSSPSNHCCHSTTAVADTHTHTHTHTPSAKTRQAQRWLSVNLIVCQSGTRNGMSNADGRCSVVSCLFQHASRRGLSGAVQSALPGRQHSGWDQILCLYAGPPPPSPTHTVGAR